MDDMAPKVPPQAQVAADDPVVRRATGARRSHHSHQLARSRVISSLRLVAGTGWRSVMTAFFCRFSGMPRTWRPVVFCLPVPRWPQSRCAARAVRRP